MDIISVIIPIYNAEATLRKCVDSLLAQTFQDFEIILVDDGSPDGSGTICDEYAQQDERIRVIHKTNGGVSSARQCGIDHARGVYTIHVDPDDWVEAVMLEELYKKAKVDDADMVICDFFVNSYKGQTYVDQCPISLNPSSMLQEIFGRLHGSTCNKLIRRECYLKYDVRFPLELSLYEDQYVIASLLKHEVKVSYLNMAFYHYERDNSKSSLSLRYSETSYQEDVKMRELFCELLRDTCVADLVYSHKSYAIVSRAFYGGRNVYTSHDFKKRFGGYKAFVKSHSGPHIEKVFVYLSCCGLYQLMINSLSLIIKTRNLLLSRKS